MKAYVKPEIRVENYNLSESIASGCSTAEGWVIRGSSDISSCYVETNQYGEIMQAFSDNTSCSIKESSADCHLVLSGQDMVLTGSY